MPRYTIGISNSLRKNEGCLILIALLLKHKVNDLDPLYNHCLDGQNTIDIIEHESPCCGYVLPGDIQYSR